MDTQSRLPQIQTKMVQIMAIGEKNLDSQRPGGEAS